jgi:hypothetical protein
MQQSRHRQPQPPLASATIAVLVVPFVWPNPSTACVDDFAVDGNVVKELKLLETVMPRPAVPKELALEASNSTIADHWL